MQLFDTHSHLNLEQFKGREEEAIRKAVQQGVDYIAVVGIDTPSIQRAIELAEQYDNIIATAGVHPTNASIFTEKDLDVLLDALKHPKVKMLGEIGLDYYWKHSTPEDMKTLFRRLIRLAKEVNMPITIHNRDATSDVYQILLEEGIPEKGCILHSFGESPEWAKKFIDLGCHLSFSGVLTFKKTHTVREAAKITPKDRLLIETDAPFLTPEPYRGKPNTPAYVKYVAEVLASVHDVSLEEIARITTQNAFEIFGWYPDNYG